MLSETLATGLEQYRIGPKIRALRLQKNLGLVQLGEHTSLSPALLSKIERGQLFPTLPTLLRIAMVFGVGLQHFFTNGEARPMIAVTRGRDRLRLPDRPDAAPPSYLFECLNFPATDRKMAVYRAEFPPDAPPSAPHRHAGAEFVHVLSGGLVVNIAGEDTALGEGDAVQFDSGVSHSYRRDGPDAAAAIIVVVP